MATKDRYQNPVVGDTVKLRLFTFNSNEYANVRSIEKVEIYALDDEKTDANPTGKRLVLSLDGSNVTNISDGNYVLELPTSQNSFLTGDYLDIWTIYFDQVDDENQNPAIVENDFKLYSNLWFTDTRPLVYDFNFSFRPNRIVQGSKKMLLIEIIPLVPRGNDLERYYMNLAIGADLKISIEMKCSDCMPAEQDLRLIVEDETVEVRERNLGYYFIDTTEMDCGLYNVWFTLTLGPNIFISDKNQLLIYK